MNTKFYMFIIILYSFAPSVSATPLPKPQDKSLWTPANVTGAALATSLILYKVALYSEFRPKYDAAYIQYNEIKGRYKSILTVLQANKVFTNLAYLTKLNELEKVAKMNYVKKKFAQLKIDNASWLTALLLAIKQSIKNFLKEHHLAHANNPDIIYRADLKNDVDSLHKTKTLLSDYRYITFTYALSVAMHKDFTLPAISLLIEQLTFIDDVVDEYKRVVLKP